MTSATLTPRQVALVGYLLYGGAWPRKVAEELEVSPRFLQRVNAAARDGQPFDIPPGFIADLRALAETHARMITQAAAQLQTKERADAH
jgi:hypothetical protein